MISNVTSKLLDFPPTKQSEDVLEEDPVGDVAFQREYLEMVEIRCGGKSAKFAGEVVQMLGELIETIGKIDILC